MAHAVFVPSGTSAGAAEKKSSRGNKSTGSTRFDNHCPDVEALLWVNRVPLADSFRRDGALWLVPNRSVEMRSAMACPGMLGSIS